MGSDDDIRVRASAGTRLIDGHGRRLIPGLNDSHSHLLRGGLSFNAGAALGRHSLAGGGAPADKPGAGKADAERTQWVRVVGGWSPWQFAERRTAYARRPGRGLDPSAGLRPVLLQTGRVVNTAGPGALGFQPEHTGARGHPPGEGDAGGELTGDLVADPHPRAHGTRSSTLRFAVPLSPEFSGNSTLQMLRTLARSGRPQARCGRGQWQSRS